MTKVNNVPAVEGEWDWKMLARIAVILTSNYHF